MTLITGLETGAIVCCCVVKSTHAVVALIGRGLLHSVGIELARILEDT